MDNNTKITIYNKYNVPHINNRVDVDAWAENFDAFIEDSETRGKRLKQGGCVFLKSSPNLKSKGISVSS